MSNTGRDGFTRLYIDSIQNHIAMIEGEMGFNIGAMNYVDVGATISRMTMGDVKKFKGLCDMPIAGLTREFQMPINLFNIEEVVAKLNLDVSFSEGFFKILRKIKEKLLNSVISESVNNELSNHRITPKLSAYMENLINTRITAISTVFLKNGKLDIILPKTESDKFRTIIKMKDINKDAMITDDIFSEVKCLDGSTLKEYVSRFFTNIVANSISNAKILVNDLERLATDGEIKETIKQVLVMSADTMELFNEADVQHIFG